MTKFKNLALTATPFILIGNIYATNFMMSNNEGVRKAIASMESINRNLATTSPTFPELQHHSAHLPSVTENLHETTLSAIELMTELIEIERLLALTYR